MSEQDSLRHHQIAAGKTGEQAVDSVTVATVLPYRIIRLLSIIGWLLLTAVALSMAVVLWLRWVPPPTSAFMLARYGENLVWRERQVTIRYQWVAWDAISPHMLLAAIAAEDQKFPDHYGFDIDSVRTAIERSRQGGRLRGASTITQQVAKNLFLWSGRSYVRKGLEAYLTLLLEWLWPKQRILEVYVNIAEFGDGVYGVQAAAEIFQGKHAADLTRREAAMLAAVLPNPRQREVRNPSSAMRERRRWIEKQMGQLGGIDYLNNL
jgi:monofunctional biosynthetic peptidoglycan transglycosylase